MFALELPERNTAECLHIRRFRQDVDRTRDPVTHALEKVRWMGERKGWLDG